MDPTAEWMEQWARLRREEEEVTHAVMAHVASTGRMAGVVVGDAETWSRLPGQLVAEGRSWWATASAEWAAERRRIHAAMARVQDGDARAREWLARRYEALREEEGTLAPAAQVPGWEGQPGSDWLHSGDGGKVDAGRDSADAVSSEQESSTVGSCREGAVPSEVARVEEGHAAPVHARTASVRVVPAPSTDAGGGDDGAPGLEAVRAGLERCNRELAVVHARLRPGVVMREGGMAGSGDQGGSGLTWSAAECDAFTACVMWVASACHETEAANPASWAPASRALLIRTLRDRVPTMPPWALDCRLALVEACGTLTAQRKQLLGHRRHMMQEAEAVRAAEREAAEAEAAAAKARQDALAAEVARRRSTATRAAVAQWRSERGVGEAALSPPPTAHAAPAAPPVARSVDPWPHAKHAAAMDAWLAKRGAKGKMGSPHHPPSPAANLPPPAATRPPDARELQAYAARAIAAAAERGAKQRAAVTPPPLPAPPAASKLFHYVMNDPTQPTTASAARATGTADVASRYVTSCAAPAHAAAVASTRPTARGKAFTMGAVGVLPSRAIPTWRAGVGR